MENKQLTQSELKELLHYNKDTGVFTWIKSVGTKKSGAIAGHINIFRSKGYYRIQLNKKNYYSHRLAWLYIHGKFPDDEIDHLDGDGTNNKWINIRAVDHVENHRNRRLQANNSSGLPGVSWDKALCKWLVRIKIKNNSVYLGYQDNLLEAACIRKNAEIKYKFHKNHGQDRPL